MEVIRRPKKVTIAIGVVVVVFIAVLFTVLTVAPKAEAGWPWLGNQHSAACGHSRCAEYRCLEPAPWAGEWHWVRSPDQEQRVVMGLYNRYCVRCHGIDGRGVWDIPDVPDFTDPRWQASRPDAQIANILVEGRGAVMPAFRGTLTIEEAWAMARYLRTFIPGTEVGRPDTGRSAAPRPTASGGTPPAADRLARATASPKPAAVSGATPPTADRLITTRR